jgi:hypothetical protein
MQTTKSARQPTPCESAESTSGKRNRFFRGKRMQSEEFDLEQRYGIGRRRLVNRAVLGWGVVAGFALEGPRAGAAVPPKEDAPPKDEIPANGEMPAKGGPAKGEQPTKDASRTFSVGPGLALDACGREIAVEKATALDQNNTFLLGADGCRIKPIGELAPGRYLLSVHYAEFGCGDANLRAECGCESAQKNFVHETAVFSLRELGQDACPCVECGCPKPCECGGAACSGCGRGPHSCLCDWVERKVPSFTPGALCEWGHYSVGVGDCSWSAGQADCSEHRAPPRSKLAGVALACVRVEPTGDRCHPFAITIEDDCGPRRLVKNNDLLYDLMRGCDLTRIEHISWKSWHRSRDLVPWDKFAKRFEPDANGVTDLVVEFSAPVQEDSIRPDVVAITVYTAEQSTGWRLGRRVPTLQPDTSPKPGTTGLPAGTTNRLRVVVNPKWAHDELEEGGESWLRGRPFLVEIEIRGDLMLDCRGQAVDANSVGISPAPSGNGTPGGTFLSSFRVALPKRDERPDHES